MTKPQLLVMSLGFVFLSGAPAFCAPAACDGVGFAQELRFARVKPEAAPLHFVKSGAGAKICPSEAPACAEKAFLVAGDLVAVGASFKNFTCVDYANDQGARAGFVASAALTPEPVIVDPTQWVGHWRRIEAEVTIEAGKDGLQAQGEATFGALDPARVKRGAVNFGSFAGALKLEAGKGKIIDSDAISGCNLKLARVGEALIIRDNGVCGGANVSFSGFYTRAP